MLLLDHYCLCVYSMVYINEKFVLPGKGGSNIERSAEVIANKVLSHFFLVLSLIVFNPTSLLDIYRKYR